MKNEFYRPAHIEFQVAHDGSNMPESLGVFETSEEMAKFIGGKLTAVNQPLTASRHMDAKEKVDIREEYSDLLENIVPVFEKKWSDAEHAMADAKKALKDAEENYNAEITQTKDLARMVKRGIVDMDLDEKYTFRVAYRGAYYFYTWIDKQLRLCLIRPIPEPERQDLYNSMSGNEEWIDLEFGAKEEKGKK
jgi:hypothetical protein